MIHWKIITRMPSTGAVVNETRKSGDLKKFHACQVRWADTDCVEVSRYQPYQENLYSFYRTGDGGEDHEVYAVPPQGMEDWPALKLSYSALRGSNTPGRYYLDGFDISPVHVFSIDSTYHLPDEAEPVSHDLGLCATYDRLFSQKCEQGQVTWE